MDLRSFKSTDFPPNSEELPPGRGDFIYVLLWVDRADTEKPFYVGETTRLRGRMRDYFLATFSCCTDFRVGEAIKYMQAEKRCRIRVKYKPTEDRRADEVRTIRALHLNGWRLLNDFVGYDYRTADADKERADIRQLVDVLMSTNGR
jgi:hypothetical protein